MTHRDNSKWVEEYDCGTDDTSFGRLRVVHCGGHLSNVKPEVVLGYVSLDAKNLVDSLPFFHLDPSELLA